MKERDALPVSRVKGLLLLTVFQQLELAISQHSITIHQQELYASGPALDFRDVMF
jgi:hypothetical protein